MVLFIQNWVVVCTLVNCLDLGILTNTRWPICVNRVHCYAVSSIFHTSLGSRYFSGHLIFISFSIRVRHVSSYGDILSLFYVEEIRSVVVTRGHLLPHAETEVPLQSEAVSERAQRLDQMPHHLYWICLKSLHQQFRKVDLKIGNLMELRVIRDLLDHGSRVLEDPLDQVHVMIWFLSLLTMKIWLCFARPCPFNMLLGAS